MRACMPPGSGEANQAISRAKIRDTGSADTGSAEDGGTLFFQSTLVFFQSASTVACLNLNFATSDAHT
jgi:hypothetical protein